MEQTAARPVDSNEISELKQRYAELAERMRLFSEATREGVAVHDNALILEANGAFAAMFGYGQAEVAGKNVLDFIAPDMREEALHRATSGTTEPYESVGLRKDGTTFPVEFCGRTHLYQGRPVRIGLVRDLSASKETVTTLKRSEARFRAAVEASFDLVWSTNGETPQDTNWQEWWHDFTGHPKEEQRGDTWLDYVHPEDRAHTESEWRRALATGEQYSIRYRLRSRKGEYHTFDFRGAPVRNTEGSTWEWVGTLKDVTEEVQAEAVRRHIAERYRAIAELSPAIAWTAGPDGSVDYYGHAWHDYTGMSPEELHGWDWSNTPIYHPDEHDELIGHWNECVRMARPYEREVRCRRHDGVYRWFLIRAVPQRDDDGRVTRWLGVAIDIHDRKEADNARASAESQLGLIANSLPVLISYIDAHERYCFTNKSYERWFGYSAEQIRGRTMHEVLGDDAYEALRPRVVAVLKGQLQVFEAHVSYRTAGERDIRATYVPDSVPGEVRGFFVLVEDITDSKRTERELKRQQARLSALFSQAAAGLAETTLDGKFTLVNDRMCEIVGRSREELLSLTVQDITHPEDLPRNLLLFHRAATDAQPFSVHTRYFRPDGSVVWVSNSVTLVRDDSGRIAAVFAVVIDVTGKKEAEDALRASEQFSRSIVESSQDCIVVLSPDGTLLSMNSSGQRILGIQDLSLYLNTPYVDLWQEDGAACAQAIAAARDGGTGSFAGALPNSAGERRWWHVLVSPIVNDKGVVRQLLSVSRDITDTKRVLRDLERATKEKENILNSITESFVALDRQWRFTYVNDRFLTRTGKTKQELMGCTIWQVFPESCESPVWAGYHRCMEERIPVRFESGYHSHVGFGTGTWYEVHVYPTDDGLCAYALDITTRKQAESALKEREAFYRTLGEAVPDFIWIADREGRLVYTNQRWMEYTGLTPEELNRLGWKALHHPDDAPDVALRWAEATRKGEGFEAEFRYRRHDGRFFWFMRRAVPLRDTDGSIIQWIGTSTEIHRLKTAQQALSAYNEQLEQFAWAAAHDLQEPLRTVSVYVQLIERRLGHNLHDGDVRQYFSHIKDSADRMSALVRDLLSYVSATASPESASCPRADCRKLAGQVVANLGRAIDAESAEIEIGDLPTVGVHAAHVVQLLQNLVENALKYRSHLRPPRVSITARRLDDGWLLSVTDNGMGIRREYHHRIFGVFKRLHGKDIAGTGIGLALCKRIVEHYGGRIWVESDGQNGSTFNFILPIAT